MMRFRSILLAAVLTLCGLPALAQQLNVGAEGEWAETTSTNLQLVNSLATTAELGSTACTALGSCPSKIFTWTSWSYDPVEHMILVPIAGGHTDWGGAENYALDLDDLATGWQRITPVQALTGELDSNGACPKPANGGPPANHTYGGVVYLGNHKHLVLGKLGFCKSGVMNPGNLAYVGDFTDKNNPVWTRVPALDIVSREVATALSVNGLVYIFDEDGRYMTYDPATGATTGPAFTGAVKRNGISMIASGSFGAQMAAGAVTSDGQFITGNDVAIVNSNINGVNVNTNNNDSFGRNIRRSIGSSAPVGSPQAQLTVGKYGIVSIGGGKVLITLGGKKYWTFKPDDQPYHRESDGAECLTPMTTAEIQACAIDGDEWAVFDPATGPTAFNPHQYQKAFFVAADSLGYAHPNMIVAYPNSGQGVWTLNLGGGSPPPVNTPPVANDDAFVGAEELQIAGNVLANDTDAETAITATALTLPPVGTLTLNPDGSFTYDPEPNFFGVVTFDYTASDGELTDTGTVTLTITDVAEPVDKYICEINEFEFPAGETPEEFPLIGTCHFERAQAELPPPPPPPPPAAESYSTPTFAARSSGALFANGFDVEPPAGKTGNTHATTVNTGNTNWVRPHRVTSQDGQGALQFDMLPLSSSGASGEYVVKLADTCKLGETCYIQWRAKFNPAWVDTQHKRWDTGGNTSPKLIIVSQWSSSNQPNEIVVTSTTGITKAPTMYHNGNFFIQIPRVTTWPYAKETWVTFNLAITRPAAGYQSGQFVYYDTHVLLQAKPDGGEVVTIADSTEAMRSQDLINDAVYWTNYTTKKDYNQDHPHAISLLDEVIISKQPIPFP
jgi:hypothetical protein